MSRRLTPRLPQLPRLHTRDNATDWAHFKGWCAVNGKAALPADPEAVAIYLTQFSRFGQNVLQRILWAIHNSHREVGFDDPTRATQVRFAMDTVRRASKHTKNSKRETARAGDVSMIASEVGSS